MKSLQKSAHRIINKDLFRIIVNRLWIEYDHGGISIKRSYQATILEGFMDLFPLDNPHYDISSDIYKEAKDRIDRFNRRNKTKQKQLELPFMGLETLSNIEFTLLSLEELCRWYKEESEELGFYYQFPIKVCNLLKDLFELSYSKKIRIRVNLNNTDKESIIKEGNRRNNHAVSKMIRVEDFMNFRISPWTNQLYNK